MLPMLAIFGHVFAIFRCLIGLLVAKLLHIQELFHVLKIGYLYNQV